MKQSSPEEVWLTVTSRQAAGKYLFFWCMFSVFDLHGVMLGYIFISLYMIFRHFFIVTDNVKMFMCDPKLNLAKGVTR